MVSACFVALFLCCWRILPLFIVSFNGGFCLYHCSLRCDSALFIVVTLMAVSACFIALLPSCCWRILTFIVVLMAVSACFIALFLLLLADSALFIVSFNGGFCLFYSIVPSLLADSASGFIVGSFNYGFCP
jgi:hypothetical protein